MDNIHVKKQTERKGKRKASTINSLKTRLRTIKRREAELNTKAYQRINDYLNRSENAIIKPYQYQLETQLRTIDVILDILKFIIPITIGAMATITSLYPKNSILIFGWILGGSFFLLIGMVLFRFIVINTYIERHKRFYAGLSEQYTETQQGELHSLFREKDDVIHEFDDLIKQVEGEIQKEK